jgi:2'-hydroxyisoflavone reductase
MSPTRREFLHTTISASALVSLGAFKAALAHGAPRAAPHSQNQALKILILGGTGFLGPAVVDVAQDRGHKITVFNRGRTEERIGRLPGDVLRLVGDRDPNKGEGLKSLETGEWDVVIDNSGYYPRMVRASAQLLKPRIGHYLYVSSISAYAKNDKPGADESTPRATLEDPTVETMGDQFQNYGGLKALCEIAVEETMDERCAIVRPGYIVGPGDPTDRFTYWPLRVQRGGEVLAPGTPDDPIQIIDVRDLAAWMIHVAEQRIGGAFNACGPARKLSMGETLEACKTACGQESEGAKAQLTWVSAEFIDKYPEPIPLPIWLPPIGETAGFHTWSNARAVAKGLTFRPVLDTARDLLEWWPKEIERRTRVGKQIIEDAQKRGDDKVPNLADLTALRASLDPELERRVLEAWRKRES